MTNRLAGVERHGLDLADCGTRRTWGAEAWDRHLDTGIDYLADILAGKSGRRIDGRTQDAMRRVGPGRAEPLR